MDLNQLRFDPVKRKEPVVAAGSFSDEAEVDRKFWKTFLLGFAGVLFAFGFSFLVRDYFFEPSVFSLTPTQYSVFAGLFALGFSVVFVLQAVLIKGLGRINGNIFFAVLAFAGAYYDRLSLELAILALALYAILFYGGYTGWHELRLMVKVKFFRIGWQAMPKIMTALALLIAFAFYLNVQDGRTNVLSKELLNGWIFRPAEPLVTKVFPAFSFEKSADEVITAFAQDRVAKDPQAAVLPAATRIKLVNELVTAMKNDVEGFVKAEVDFKKNISDITYDLLVDRIIVKDPENKQIVAISVATLAFFILKAIGFVFGIGALFVAFLAFEILLAMEFATVVLESKTREMVIMK